MAGAPQRPGQAAQLPLSAEVSLRTIRSRWKRWHLAFACAPPLPVNGCRAASLTLELVPQHSLVEAQAQLQSLSCRAACPFIPFVRGAQFVSINKRCPSEGTVFAGRGLYAESTARDLREEKQSAVQAIKQSFAPNFSHVACISVVFPPFRRTAPPARPAA